ncbi:MAG: hypothetical protein J6Y02_16320 [Pseudobutyrivibrio sp.]|nr:hypothetical protein [Pseudobutyrivibrio sp.]
MDISAMRNYILKMYPGPRWTDKVAHMSDNQVMAVYFSMKNKGQQPIKESKERQATIYDYDEEGCFIVRR